MICKRELSIGIYFHGFSYVKVCRTGSANPEYCENGMLTYTTGQFVCVECHEGTLSLCL